MDFSVLTIFPEMFAPYWEQGIIRRAIESGIITAAAVNIRDFAEGRYKVTDDRPYGGGCGMVMKPEPLGRALRFARESSPVARTILLSPQGRVFDQSLAEALALEQGLILVCGRYEGVDERIIDGMIDEEISIGDFVLTGGELAAMVVVDAVTRLLPGALGGEDSAEKDSFSCGLLEHPHYTRPRVYEGEEVPEVLLSGNHSKIDTWRRESALMRTALKRPDLLLRQDLTSGEIAVLRRWCTEIEDVIRSLSLRGTDSLPGGE